MKPTYFFVECVSHVSEVCSEGIQDLRFLKKEELYYRQSFRRSVEGDDEAVRDGYAVVDGLVLFVLLW